MAIARGEHVPGPEELKVWFASIQSFARLLSESNWRLLELIAQENPRSLTELAEKAGRSKGNLSRTLQTMSRHELVEIRRGPRGTLEPCAPFDQVQLNLSLSRKHVGEADGGS